ncbi:FAR1-related protein [Striga asiatica]|uniref:FAR1-related protein n=1 Tax=Striga asiatica TaxID=4170 RepID=A0A5A7RH54_STRAF|nr:FAR1-related protein [Striga asiatica]
MDYEIESVVNSETVGSSSNFERQPDDDDAIVGIDIKVDVDDSSERELFRLEDLQDVNCSAAEGEPYVGQEFESEAAAHTFYNSYATSVGFVIRVSKLSRSRRDGSTIGRALVCNKEGFRMPDKREKVVRQRAETRVGCRAMILVRKVSSGKWVVTKFVKEHTHPLAPGKVRKDLIYDQYPNEHDKIRELSHQLAIEKKKVATYKRHLEMIFEHIEEHNQSLAKKIEDIVESVREMESKEHAGQFR